MAASAAASPRLGGEVLGHRALDVERALARVEALGGLLDRRSRRFQRDRVRDDQLVRVALLLGERAACLDALARVGDRAVERLPAGAEPERRHHQPRVAEHLLGLDEALTLDAADQPIGGHVDLVEEQRRGVAEPDAVLVLVVAVREALGAGLDHEPARPAGGEREDRVEIGHAAVGDPLLDAADAVAAVTGSATVLSAPRSLPASGSVAP